MVVTFSKRGYVKRVPEASYKSQRPGGKGRIGAKVSSEDVVNQILYASSHDVLLCFSNRGRVHWIRVFQIPEESPYSRGKAIINLLRLEPDERICQILPLEQLDKEGYIVMVTAKGIIKKTAIEEFSRPRLAGLIAVTIEPEDELIAVNFTAGSDEILLATAKGKAIRFSEDQVRPMGRQARGVTGIRMNPDDLVIGMAVIANEAGTLLTITQSGYGKRTQLSEYPVTSRGGKGVITIKNTKKLGDVVAIQMVEDEDHLLILTSGGRIIRLRMSEISVIGRNTMGRTLVRMDPGESVVDVARAEPSEEDDKLGEDAGDLIEDSDLEEQTESEGEEELEDELEEDETEEESDDDARD
jgi:DNA gyrase subunit A